LVKKSFLCRKCHHQFETEIVKNATIICPNCLSKDLKELSYEKGEDSNQKIKKPNNNQKPNGDLNSQLKKEESIPEVVVSTI
jgi:DNA-directed RNA polymerase subunit RPC12/RpoP